MTTPYVLLSDGTYKDGKNTVPAGDVVNRILWDGVTPYTPPAGVTIATDDGTHPYWVAPTPPQKTIDSLDFIRRFTPAEQVALISANPLWPVMIAAAGTVDVTDPILNTDIQQAVAGGLLTQLRVAQILNLDAASP